MIQKLIKTTILILLFNHFVYALPMEENSKVYLLVENNIDYAIAKDIKNITQKDMNLSLEYGTYSQVIDRVLSDPKAQFAIVPNDTLLYEKNIKKVKDFEKNIKMIIPLYDELIHILVRKDAHFKDIKALNFKRVNIEIGNNLFSSLGRLIQRKHNISWKESHYSSKNAIKKLLNKDLDAVIIVEAKPSAILHKISKKDGVSLSFLSPKLGKEYGLSFLNHLDYDWLDTEIETNTIHKLLISYNYQKSKVVQRFNNYVENISNLVMRVSKNMNILRAGKNAYWKKIYPYSYRKIAWSLHPMAKKSIYKYMDRLNHFTNTFGMEFIAIPSGEFMMGSKSKKFPLDEKPQLKKYVKSFYMLRNEVTQKDWVAIMGENPSFFNEKRLNKSTLLNPVDSISFKDAKAFIKKLNRSEGRGKYRLPTETEWEYASYDMTPSKKSLQNLAWYSQNSFKHSHRVRGKKANKWGLYDMQGNVWEWCSSYYTKNHKSEAEKTKLRLLKGGSFLNLPTTLRVQNRMSNTQSMKRFNNGFRVVYDKRLVLAPYQYYQVKAGDTLSNISKRFYGNAKRWDIIYYANKDTIGKNPSRISSKHRLIIPRIGIKEFKDEVFKSSFNAKGIKLLSGTDFKPFLSPTLPNGGMANHIVKKLFKTLGYENYKIFWNKNFSEHFPLLEEGKMDVGIAWYKPDCSKTNLSTATARRCQFAFSKPIFEVLSTFYKRKDNKINPRVPKDIYLSKICRPKGIYIFDLENQGLEDGKSMTLVRPDSKEDCFKLLLEKKVDFVAIDKFAGASIIKEMNIEDAVSSIESMSTLLGMHLIVHRSNPRLEMIMNVLNQGIQKLKNNGQLKEIQTKHLSHFFSSVE